MWRPSAWQRFSTWLAMVDLPAPDRPVNHSTAGCWPFISERAALSTSSWCQTMSALRVRIAVTMPAPTVPRVRRSIRMKPPSSRLVSYVSHTTGWVSEIDDTADLVQGQFADADFLQRLHIQPGGDIGDRGRRRFGVPSISR